MIVDVLLIIVSWFIRVLVFILPAWSPWPQDLLDGLTYFFSSLAKLNFLFPIDTLFTIILFVINFEVLYFGAKLLTKVINFFRGTGEGIKI